MRRLLSALLTGAVLAGVVIAAPLQPARAETSADSCAEGTGPPDLSSGTFTFSASSFSVAAPLCRVATTYGEYLVTVHLTSFTPEVQISAAFQDLGKYIGYSGFRVCAEAVCPTSYPSGFLTPAGTRIDGPCLYDVYFCSAPRPSGYGAWSDVLPAGTSVPDTISWYADVRVHQGADPTFPTVTDRVPDSGTTSSARNLQTLPTTVTATPGSSPTWNRYGVPRTDTGRLDTPQGPLADRLVQVRPRRWDGQRVESTTTGAWTTAYGVERNTTVQACFAGDGVHDPGCSRPYVAGVKAFVSLNLAQSTTVRRGSSLPLQGVVRPAYQTGQVRVLVREDRPGTTYRLLRYTNLSQAQGDSYYRTTWSPTVRGRYVLRTLWTGGSTAAGGVQGNISDYRIVTVT